MLSLQNFEFGRERLIVVSRGYRLAGAGQQTTQALDDVPSEIDGLAVNIKSFILELGSVTYNVAASKISDGVSLSQLLNNVSIQCSENSPPAMFNGGHQILSSIDWYRGAMGLQFLSNQPIWLPRQNIQPVITVPASDQSYTALAANTFQRVRGWPQYTGPFASAGAGGAYANTATYRIEIPVGMRYGEHADDQAVPGRWWNGIPAGKCARGEPGQIQFTQSALMDGLAVTWNATQWNLYARVSLSPKERTPIPTMPFVRVWSTSDNTFRVDPLGMLGILGFFKPLSSGAQVAADYTEVNLWNKWGQNLIQPQINVNTEFLARNLKRDEYRPTGLFTAMSHAATARFTSAGVPLVLWDDQLVRAMGSLDQPLKIEVVTSGETTNYIMAAGWKPVTSAMRACAEEWAGASSSVPETQNGNEPAMQLGQNELVPQSALRRVNPGSTPKPGC